MIFPFKFTIPALICIYKQDQTPIKTGEHLYLCTYRNRKAKECVFRYISHFQIYADYISNSP